MAPEKETESNDVPALPAPKTRKKMIVIVAAALIVAGVGVPAGYFLLGSTPEPEVTEAVVGNLEQSEASAVVNDDSLELEEGEEALGAILPFETFLVNLAGGKYIRLQMQIEFESSDVPKKIYSRMVPIRDSIITLLTQQDASDLEDLKGKEKLKKNIRELINERLHREDVRRVYFTQFVIQ
jgi:flagellar FliL protein